MIGWISDAILLNSRFKRSAKVEVPKWIKDVADAVSLLSIYMQKLSCIVYNSIVRIEAHNTDKDQ